MNRFLLATAAALLALSASADAQQRVYQWKDANGVTHYTDTPPPQNHQVRELRTRAGSAPAAQPAREAANPQCENARANLARLQGGDPVAIDLDGDGKPDRDLDENERQAQAELNQAAVKALCPQA